MITTPYRDLLPPLTTEEFAALRLSIAQCGIRNACLATEDGRLLDGHNRLNIDPNAPMAYLPGSLAWSDEECQAYIFRCARERRNLSPEQKREVRTSEIKTARRLRQQDAKRWMPPVLSEWFGVALSTMYEWLNEDGTTNSGIGISCTPPDARVKIAPAHYALVVDRVNAGETQAQVAADYGVTQQQVSNILKRVRAERDGTALSSSSASGCTIADLEALVAQDRKFGTIYADPPWRYENQGTRAATDNHYLTMTLEELTAIPVPALSADQAHLHLWTTNGFLPDGMRLLHHWGFKYKGFYVWVKPKIGIGNYWRVAHEIMLLGVKGGLVFRDKSLRSWGEFPRNKHSAKPEEVRALIEKASPGPYLELFGRRLADGWTVWGNQIERDFLFIEVNDTEEKE